MLSLNSSRWSELQHAYGTASDIPDLLRELTNVPDSRGDAEPWFSLWSSLAHQGDVYSASFAAVPHIIQVLASAPLKADSAYFQFPAWVEICRAKHKLAVPEDLAASYFESLSRLPTIVGAAAVREWDNSFLSCALSAIAASKGQHIVAEALLELSPETAGEFMQWFYGR
ncbi:hypothetical protein SAMN04515618_10871 [Collimonas sp. OK307]|uniref:hypothetical protein n=1 Tax=Collimonas sp. OK307 TaxID=1801620 RepID=UPI0008E0068E|nr:hypothetical protein [Collimonas sp. OK307]SFI02746.1 hypothetical protein SAMN04515618_10871 [Collimonas sp. OK307]